jgi:predicted helicase
MIKQIINQYYNQRDNLKRVGVTNEMAIKQPFDNLLLNLASEKHYVYATEVTIKNESGKNIRPDGILMTELRIHKGYVESKDTNDTLDEEINKKLFKDGYPKTNIIFQDSIFAVLFQNGVEVSRVEMADSNELEKILNQFINYVPDYIEKFNEALEKFKEDIPIIVTTLREVIDFEYTRNDAFIKGFKIFFEMCQKEINPHIAKEDIREMIIQHILTEDIFKAIFDEADFHHENNIASQLEILVNTFMSRTMRLNQLSGINHYYKTINTQAALVADHQEKQKFLKIVYENFYKMYNPKGADKLGVVYTPNEIVRFMVQSTDYLLQKHFSKELADKNVHILDPATGTGTFITDIIDFIPSQYLEHKYKNEIFANEVAILPYYIANLNIEYTFKQKMKKYIEFPNSCFVDTLDNIDGLSFEGKQQNMFGLSSENADRIKRQNEQKISVIIGNPPYNANQINYNDNNKNREYPDIDERIKNTYVKNSKAQKTKVYDMYARFYRWATDRLDNNGVIAFITNRSFIDSKTFDGFRKSVQDEFDFCYIVDLKGDIRGKDKDIAAKSNVFGIKTGVAILFLIKKDKITNEDKEEIKIKYVEISDNLTKKEKLAFLSNTKFNQIAFESINSNKNNDWINQADNSNWQHYVQLVSKNAKLGKGNETIFTLYSYGTSTNRDEWVYDFCAKNLYSKAKFLSTEYNLFIKNNELKTTIKLSRDLQNKFKRKLKSKFDKNLIKQVTYRPFIKKQYYAEKLFSDVLTQNHYMCFGKNLDKNNKIINIINHSRLNFMVFSTKSLCDASFCGEGTPNISLYQYDQEGNRHDNITDWGLSQFQNHYETRGLNPLSITKEDIFYYTYAVLHNPTYRKKYELNLKREFPRLPFYDDFFQWVAWGKQLMDLHIDYETVTPYDLKVIDDNKNLKDKNYKLKAKLKADKINHEIAIDEITNILGIPKIAWEYKLGNRSALEWVLDQYKEKKYSDKTIEENFNTYRFADYKESVIDLLKRVCTVSVETMRIIEEMAKCIKK